MSHSSVCPLIFTDLDGTVLDHVSYSPEPADDLIKSLHKSGAAKVMPVTSKTQAELTALDQQLPFKLSVKVSENGAVIHAPTGFPFSTGNAPETLVLGTTYRSVLKAVNVLPAALRKHFNGFADMDAEEVSWHTGLTLSAARRATERQSTEPFLWSGTPAQLEDLRGLMAASGIQIQQGGRFFHLTGSATKKQAMHAIVAAYEEREPAGKHVSVALGDGPNDLEMIEAADYGVIIPNDAGAAITSDRATVRTARYPGPRGWAAAVTDILRELGMQ